MRARSGNVVVLLAGALIFMGLTGCGKKQESGPPQVRAPKIESGSVASADGVKIHYQVTGRGEPTLVFVHGWSCRGDYWQRQVDHFHPFHRVVTLDLAGHGESGRGRDRWTVPAFAADVRAVVEKLDLQSVVLIGHSLSGKIIVEVASSMPDRVVGLIGVDTLQDLAHSAWPRDRVDAFLAPLREDFPQAAARFARALFPAGADTALVNRVAADLAAAPPDIAVAVLEEALPHNLSGALAKIEAPVRVINCDRWGTDVEANRKLVPSFELVQISGVGHYLFLERPERFNKELTRVLKGLTRERGMQ